MFKWKNKTLDGFEQEKIKKNILPYSILVAALFAMTFFGVCAPNNGPSGPKGAAAYIGSETITYREFRRAYQNQSQRLRSQYGDDFDASKLRIAETTLNQLVGNRLDYLYALDLGIVSSKDEVYKFLASADVFKDDSGNFSQENFKTFLRNYSYTEASFFEEWERNLTVQKLNKIITSTSFVPSSALKFDYLLSETKMDLDFVAIDSTKVKAGVTESEVTDFLKNAENVKKVEDYYAKNPREFNKEEQVKASHILISFKGARNASGDAAKRSKADAMKLAEKVRGIALKSDFATTAKKYTDEPSGKTSGGDLGFFSRNMMVKEFSEVAFSLKKGEISKVTESPFGFHVIKVVDKQKEVKKTLEQAKKSIARTIILKEKGPKAAKELASKILDALKSGKSEKSLLSSNGLKWDSTGEFSVASAYVPKLGADNALKQEIFNVAKAGQVIGKVITVGDNNYVIRVKSLSKASEKSFDEDQKEKIASSANFSQGYMFYTALSRENREGYEKRNAIQRNQSYLKLDAPVAN